jgi:hypothetical protein
MGYAGRDCGADRKPVPLRPNSTGPVARDKAERVENVSFRHWRVREVVRAGFEPAPTRYSTVLPITPPARDGKDFEQCSILTRQGIPVGLFLSMMDKESPIFDIAGQPPEPFRRSFFGDLVSCIALRLQLHTCF